MNTEISTKSKKLSVQDLKEEWIEALSLEDLDEVVGGSITMEDTVYRVYEPGDAHWGTISIRDRLNT